MLVTSIHSALGALGSDNEAPKNTYPDKNYNDSDG